MRAFVAAMLLVAACKGKSTGDRFDQILAELAVFKDRMCACTDAACADAVMTERREYRKTMRQKLDKGARPTEAQDRAGKQLEDALEACYKALRPPVERPAEAGSAE